MRQKRETPPPELVDTAGEYDVQVRLRLGAPEIPFLLRVLPYRIWTGDVESNTIRVVVHPPGTYLPKRIDFPPGREEGWVCQCRADCNPELPENPCLQLPLEEQSQTAIGFNTTSASAIEGTRAQARSRLVFCQHVHDGLPRTCKRLDGANEPFASTDVPVNVTLTDEYTISEKSTHGDCQAVRQSTATVGQRLDVYLLPKCCTRLTLLLFSS